MSSRLQEKVALVVVCDLSVDVLFNPSATAYFNRLEDISDEECDRAPRDEVDLFPRDECLVTCGG